MYVDPSAVTLPLALLAGIFSFVSPCVLPLVPAYIGYLTGQATNTAGEMMATAGGGGTAVAVKPSRFVVFLHGVSFVIGFSLIFVLLGVTVGAIGEVGRGFFSVANRTLFATSIAGLPLRLTLMGSIGGLLIIVLGLHTMGVIRIPFLYYDTRKQAAPKHELGYLGSLLMGVTFSAGWSPCLGPILAAMLTLGATTGSAGRAAALLTAYALGLGIPFLLTALLVDRATPQLRRIQKHMRVIELISGGLLILVGLIIFTGALQPLLAPLTGGSELSLTLDEWLVRLVGGQ